MTEWATPVTWLIVIAGWYVVNNQNNARIKRNEIRRLVDDIQRLLDDIEINAIQYHTQADRTHAERLSFLLKQQLNTGLSDKLALLNDLDVNLERCWPIQAELRKAITLDNFDSDHFKQQNYSSDIVRNTALYKNQLSREIERAFSKKYHFCNH